MASTEPGTAVPISPSPAEAGFPRLAPAPPLPPVVELRGVAKVFDSEVVAVEAVDLQIRPGKIVGLIGANGAGKTTLLRLALGLLRPTRGEVRRFGGVDAAEASRRMGYLPQGAGYYEWMTVREYLAFSLGHYLDPRDPSFAGRIERALGTFGLADVTRRKVGKLSKGQQKRVGLAQALVHDPDFTVLDEPFEGLDPIGRRDLMRLLAEVADGSRTFLISSHMVQEILQISTDLCLLNRGRLAFAGPKEELFQEQGGKDLVTLRCGGDAKGFLASLQALPWGRPARRVGDRLEIGVPDGAAFSVLLSLAARHPELAVREIRRGALAGDEAIYSLLEEPGR